VRPPDRHEVHDAVALDEDHVLAEQVLADVRHRRLREQQQLAEPHSRPALGELLPLGLHGHRGVADSSRT